MRENTDPPLHTNHRLVTTGIKADHTTTFRRSPATEPFSWPTTLQRPALTNSAASATTAAWPDHRRQPSILQRLGPDSNARLLSGVPELAVERRERDFCADRLLPGQGRRELDRVIAAQREVPGNAPARETSASVTGTLAMSGHCLAKARCAFRPRSGSTTPSRTAFASAAATSARVTSDVATTSALADNSPVSREPRSAT